MSAHRLLILLIPILISGCGSFGWKSSVPPLEIQKKAIERTRLNIADPSPPKVITPTWVIVTPENAEQVFNNLREKNVDLVLFALTDDGYEELSITIAEIRNFMASQRAVLIKYREYYEPPKTPDPK